MSVRLYDMMHFEIKTTESASKVLSTPFNPLFRAFNCNKLSLLEKSFLLFLLSAHLKVDYFELVSNIALTSHKLSFLSSTSLIKNTTFDTV